VLTPFVVVGNIERSRWFYADVFGGEVVMEGERSIVALARLGDHPCGRDRKDLERLELESG
jgi:catechol 2,3-dioxygenase-like lactoylglutathione lyase family enzyme